MVASECAPVAQAGGLGEVVFGLSRELELRGNAVEIILPKYDCMRYDRIAGLTVAYEDLWVPWYSGAIHCSVWFGFVEGRKCFFIEPHSQDRFFERGHLYGSVGDVFRFFFFVEAVVVLLRVVSVSLSSRIRRIGFLSVGICMARWMMCFGLLSCRRLRWSSCCGRISGLRGFIVMIRSEEH